MSGTLITSDVDVDAHGKQQAYLRVPHSVHRSAYGWIPVPIAVIRNGDGPTLVISAGVHGDEYEGQIAVATLIRTLDATDIRGRLILLPMVNVPAAEAGCRTSPIDAGNLNRLYPGDPKGMPSQMIAHFHEEVILPLADYAVDLHSGGSSLIYPATVMRGPSHSPQEEDGLATLVDAFDLPYTWVFQGGGGRDSTARTAMGAANRKGVINVMAELGGAGCVTPDVLHRTERGLRRILHAVGMLPGYVPDGAQGTRAVSVQGSVYAFETGVFEPLKSIGGDVVKGEAVAHIHHPETPGKAPDVVLSPHAGMVLAMRAMAQVRRGDALYQIAADAG
ncbi:succinylglutamate desuccinylase/aspartoacylase family protein [Jannaschia sp. CCS1]|uniref:succinylglutamate desuccinylase/aspartoacylase family protein n=1 Tax=Jannaschia sp. (strain CCS1) TaxID=290400 RepID=UPI000053D686|nr:succinylglutamate desuccinylase/aspartoacylase family protein [Jannaschia sp. CCS1]ABD55017.1 Succinylglutamate desuccinylase/aspartoacylase [Jannaschia sp. CCS1]